MSELRNESICEFPTVFWISIEDVAERKFFVLLLRSKYLSLAVSLS